MGSKPGNKKPLRPITYTAAYYDPERNIKVYAADLTQEQHEEISKQITLNFVNSLLRPYGAAAYIEE